LQALGDRFRATGHPRGLTLVLPIAAGDMYGIKGIDHIARPGMLKKVLAGSYPSGPSSATPPAIWQMVTGNAIPAYNIPSGILFDMHREAAAHRPGVLTKVGLDTFVDPDREGCAMNARAAAEPVVSKVQFAGDTWLFFPAVVTQVAIIRATTADERGNLSYEHEGGYLGPLDQALAVRNNGGIVIAQVKRLAQAGTLRPHDVMVPGILVDAIVVAPEIQALPDDANGYNEYAWLVANTEGDVRKAVRYSKKSLEISFDNPSYLDTLAHCRFAAGDHAAAVRTQAIAQRLEPHNRTILRNLERFRSHASSPARP
jgi:acyl CoA:acetate/3-ketoacid CoA transferase